MNNAMLEPREEDYLSEAEWEAALESCCRKRAEAEEWEKFQHGARELADELRKSPPAVPLAVRQDKFFRSLMRKADGLDVDEAWLMQGWSRESLQRMYRRHSKWLERRCERESILAGQKEQRIRDEAGRRNANSMALAGGLLKDYEWPEDVMGEVWGMVTPPDAGGCRGWLGETNEKGYAIFRWGRGRYYVHKLILCFRLKKEYPHDRLLEAAHYCSALCGADHKWCVVHAEFLTPRQHAADKKVKKQLKPAKGDGHWLRKHPELARRGEQVATAILSWDEVRELRKEHKRCPEIRDREFGLQYGVSRWQINRILNNKAWIES